MERDGWANPTDRQVSCCLRLKNKMVLKNKIKTEENMTRKIAAKAEMTLGGYRAKKKFHVWAERLNDFQPELWISNFREEHIRLTFKSLDQMVEFGQLIEGLGHELSSLNKKGKKRV